jgi:PAS domain S-box-containing protein
MFNAERYLSNSRREYLIVPLEQKTRKKKKNGTPDIERSLRSDAENRVKRARYSSSGLNEQDKEKLIHELQVHQIELEMQNEAIREAHLALEESRDKYIDLYEFAPLGYITLTDKAIISEANLTSATLLGVERDKLRKARFSKFIDEKDAFEWHQFFIKVLKQTEKLKRTLMLRRPDGSLLSALLEGMPIRGSNGELTVRLAISDVTDIGQTVEVRSLLANIVDFSNDAIIGETLDGIITSWNAAAENIYGYTSEEVVGKPVSMLLAPEERDEIPRILEKIRVGEHIDHMETKRRTKDGRIIDISLTLSPIKNDEGQILGASAIVRDITKRKLRDKTAIFLIHSGYPGYGGDFFNSLARFLAENLDMDYVCIDTLEGDGLTARTVSVFNDGKFDPNVQYALKDTPCGAVVGKNICSFPSEVCRLFPDDVALQELKAESYIGTTLWGSDGKPIGLIALIRRRPLLNPEPAKAVIELVATRAAGEMELRRKEEELRKSLEEKELLLAEIHHRVKNNLAAFIALLSLDGTHEDSPAGKLLKQDLQNRARSMALIHETIYKTRKFSSVDMGVYLPTLTDQVAATFRSDKSIRTVVKAEGVSLDLNRSTPCGLIVNELITNAFKYAFPPSFDCRSVRQEICTIWVSFTMAGGYYTLSVRDNGIGLPETFDLTTAKSLGLKLVNFLAHHNLKADIEISRKDGTEFLIRFRE